MNIELLLLIFTILLTGLSVGVFYGYSTSVNGALHRLNDDGYLRTMQHINRVIMNPLFLGAFMLPVILLPLVTLLYGGPMDSLRFWLFAAASLGYIFGMFGITMSGNMPLNNWIDTLKLDMSSKAELSEFRTRFEQPWNRLHTIRTVIGIISFILVLWGSLLS